MKADNRKLLELELIKTGNNAILSVSFSKIDLDHTTT